MPCSYNFNIPVDPIELMKMVRGWSCKTEGS